MTIVAHATIGNDELGDADNVRAFDRITKKIPPIPPRGPGTAQGASTPTEEVPNGFTVQNDAEGKAVLIVGPEVYEKHENLRRLFLKVEERLGPRPALPAPNDRESIYAGPFGETILKAYDRAFQNALERELVATTATGAMFDIDPETIIKTTGSLRLSEIDRTPPPDLLFDMLDPTSHTILFGPGGVGKGMEASRLAVKITTELGLNVLIIDFENHPDEWLNRIDGLGGPAATGKIDIVCPTSRAWTAPRGPFWTIQQHISALAVERGSQFLIIDSIAAACVGSDISTGDTSAPTLYGSALEAIGLPCLSISHVAGVSQDRPFGSVYWGNFARMMWQAKANGQSSGTVFHNTKHNRYAKQHSYVVTYDFVGSTPVRANVESYEQTIADRLRDILIGVVVPMKTHEVAAELNEGMKAADQKVSLNTVERTLRKGLIDHARTPKRFAKVGGGWLLAEIAPAASTSQALAESNEQTSLDAEMAAADE